MISESERHAPITALNGTRVALTRREQCRQPGIARSRENAKHVREALVRQAAPQKNWPTRADQEHQPRSPAVSSALS